MERSRKFQNHSKKFMILKIKSSLEKQSTNWFQKVSMEHMMIWLKIFEIKDQWTQLCKVIIRHNKSNVLYPIKTIYFLKKKNLNSHFIIKFNAIRIIF